MDGETANEPAWLLVQTLFTAMLAYEEECLKMMGAFLVMKKCRLIKPFTVCQGSDCCVLKKNSVFCIFRESFLTLEE